MIIEVTQQTLPQAAAIHSAAWKDSHRAFCSPAFVEAHTVERQLGYLLSQIQAGKRLYMLIAHKAVGIVSVADDLIENLYVLPTEQRKGFGTKLLHFACSQCAADPVLWVLSNNLQAQAFYRKYGFSETGVRKQLSDTLYEMEMRFYGNH